VIATCEGWMMVWSWFFLWMLWIVS